VVMPHSEVAFERFIVDIDQIVIGGDPTTRMHVRERLELGQRRLASDWHPRSDASFVAPLRVQPLQFS